MTPERWRGLRKMVVAASTWSEHGSFLRVLDRALDSLAERDAMLAQVMDMGCFAGLTDEEIAKELGTSTRTVKRNRSVARAWLASRLVEPSQ